MKHNTYPDENDLNNLITAVKLEITLLTNALSEGLPPITLSYRGKEEYNHKNVIKTQQVNPADQLNSQYQQAKHTLNYRMARLTPHIIRDTKAKLKEIFSNEGPSFTTHLLESDRNPCLLALLETYRDELAENATQMETEIQTLEQSAKDHLTKATKAFFSKEAKKDAYIKAQIQTYQARLDKDIFAGLSNMYNEIITTLEAKKPHEV